MTRYDVIKSKKNPSLKLCQRAEVVLDLTWLKSFEFSLFVADSNFNIGFIHLTLERLLQGQNRRVDGIIKLQLLIVTALQK